MTARRVLAAGALAAAVLTGCGGTGDRAPARSGLPLVSGARVDVSQRTCDRGADAFCALQLVVTDPGYRTAKGLRSAEQQLLRRRHWAKADAPIGLELAADSPADGLRVTYATANADLEGWDLGWIKRARPIALALTRAIFEHTAALSVQLVLGTG